jgi:phage-related protein
LHKKANPIGIIITAVALLTAGMVKLFKSNETFRNAVIAMAKAALTAFASIIPMVAKVFEAIMKIITGPLRLFLTGLSKLPGVGKLAKGGLDLINKGLDGISDFGDKAAKKAKELTADLDKLAKQGKKAAEETEKGWQKG